MPQEPADQVIITRLRFRQFLGIEDLDLTVPRAGVVFTGTNAVGKSSAIYGINALFEGVGIGPDAIRFDAEKAELLVDFTAAQGALAAKREIERDGTRLRLERADGTPVPRAKEQIRAMFGDRPLDPFKLYSADPKTRRQMILAACPAKVTAEQLNAWCETQQPWDTQGHGFEVLARVRQLYFDRRTEANRAAGDAGARLRLAEEAAAKERPQVVENMSPDAARSHVAAAERDLAVLHERRRAMAEREEQAGATMAKVSELRAKAEELICSPDAVGPTDEAMAEAEREEREASGALEEARLAFLRAEAYHRGKEDLLKAARAARAAAQKKIDEANTTMAQADALEAAVAQGMDDGVAITTQIAEAEGALAKARELVARAEQTAKHRAMLEQVEAAKREKDASAALAETLDRIVNRLTKDAPAELAKSANTIPGLEVTPTTILMDGKNIDRLSGAERLRLCVAVAKKVVTGAKILTVDEMEKIAPALLPDFVRACIADGWQLFGTRVADGPLDVVDCYSIASRDA